MQKMKRRNYLTGFVHATGCDGSPSKWCPLSLTGDFLEWGRACRCFAIEERVRLSGSDVQRLMNGEAEEDIRRMVAEANARALEKYEWPATEIRTLTR